MATVKRLFAILFGASLAAGALFLSIDTSALQRSPQVSDRTPRNTSYVLDCTTPPLKISPLIYGIGGGGPLPGTLGATARRWGGNPTTRYNWERNTWNLTKDWFYKNTGNPGSNYEEFLVENQQRGVTSALTLPMIDWVAKDATSYSFPVSVFGRQQNMAPDAPDAGNGMSVDGKPIAPGPPTLTSVRSTPESIERWVRAIREKDKTRGRSVDTYILDNEPMLWNSTHRDVHPQPATYDELLDKTIAYATAIRRADPEGRIAGPAEWGWLAYHYSAKDVDAGVYFKPDRLLHGDLPLIPWYLRMIREHELKTNTKLLDLLDVHFYAMGDGIGVGTGGKTDEDTAARRIRATRSLWDPNYVDESWINEKMQVLPLLRRWIASNHPGLGIQIGEWNFGAETHMSGGLATAEALGRFGVEGVEAAYYWTAPETRSPSFWAFRAYRNFDGEGGRFLDSTVRVKGDGSLSSLFASRGTERGRMVLVLLNFSPASPLNTRIFPQGCGVTTGATLRAFTYTGGEAGFAEMTAATTNDAVDVTAPPYSINVVDVRLGGQ